MKLEYIKGYYSKTGFFYSISHLKHKIEQELQKNEVLTLDIFNYLPSEIITNAIADYSTENNDALLQSVDNNTYYSSQKIYEKINKKVIKNSYLNLRNYQEILRKKDFLMLIQHLPKQYLSEIYKGTYYLTNAGKTHIINHLNHSKLVGHFNITHIAQRLHIPLDLIKKVVDEFIDPQSGIYDCYV